MEVRFSPPNLKRIGYPKNTIYMNKQNIMFGIVMFVAITSIGYGMYNDYNTDLKIKSAINSYKMYSADEQIKESKGEYGIDGLWHSDVGFYCIKYDAENEQDVIVHEKCHALVENDYYHFCEEYI
jgi:hypothetical protein